MYIFKDIDTIYINELPRKIFGDISLCSWIDISAIKAAYCGGKPFEWYFKKNKPNDENLFIRKAHGISLINNDKNLGETIGSFNITLMPGCHGVVIMHNMEVRERYRNMGWGQVLHVLQIELFKTAGYGMMLCTTNVDNTIENKILYDLNWKIIQSLSNPLTNNNCYMWSRLL